MKVMNFSSERFLVYFQVKDVHITSIFMKKKSIDYVNTLHAECLMSRNCAQISVEVRINSIVCNFRKKP